MSGLSKVQQWLADVLNVESKPKRITPETSLTIAAVWYAATKISGDVGQLPLCPYVREGDNVNKDTGSAAYRLLRHEANAYQTAHAFKELLCLHALLWGNGRAYIRRDQNGQPVELIPMLPDRTETVLIEGEKFHATKPERDERFSLFEDMERDPKGTVTVDDADCLHVMGPSIDGIAGVSVVAMARTSLSISSAADHRSERQMRKGFTGKVMLQAPAGSLRPKGDAEELLADFRKTHNADEDGEQVGLLREGITANVLNLSNGDMQFLESRAFQRQEVMQWFGLDSMPGDKDSVSYNSLAQKSLAYHQGTLSRWCDRWVQACDKSLLSETEKRQDSRFFKFITAAMLRGTTKERYDVYQIGRQIGVLSSNDVRKMEDLNPREGGDDYGNPAITPETPGQEAATTMQPEQGTTANNAARVMIENLIGVEANKAANAVKSRNFVSWMDKFYPKWEAKLADAIESIGGDRDLATVHCRESRKRLLECADKATVETLPSVVNECVQNWKQRAGVILEEMELASV